jgi:hypothetical protein
MAFVGADVEQLRALGAELGSQAGALEDLGRRVGIRIDAVDWRGPDAAVFREDWNTRHLVALRRVADVLAQVGETARRQAAEQHDASVR